MTRADFQKTYDLRATTLRPDDPRPDHAEAFKDRQGVRVIVGHEYQGRLWDVEAYASQFPGWRVGIMCATPSWYSLSCVVVFLTQR